MKPISEVETVEEKLLKQVDHWDWGWHPDSCDLNYKDTPDRCSCHLRPAVSDLLDQAIQATKEEMVEEFAKHTQKIYDYLEQGEKLAAAELAYNCIMKYSPQQCECPLQGQALPHELEHLYSDEEKAVVNHKPYECKGTYQIRKYIREGKELRLCSCCYLFEDTLIEENL